MNVRMLLFAVACATPTVAFAQSTGVGTDGIANGVVIGVPNPATPRNLVAPNTTPGGITLVPGTVVVPGVGGTVVTGTVPLAGTVGSTGVGNFNPGFGSAANPEGGPLYPVVPFSQIPSTTINQSAMPQTQPSGAGVIYGAPFVAN
jgi:hypothetical protein